MHDNTHQPDEDTVRYKLVTGTHTDGSMEESIRLLDVDLPSESASMAATSVDPDATVPGQVGTYGGYDPKVSQYAAIQVPAEVNKARVCPHNSTLIAAALGSKAESKSGTFAVYDFTKYSATDSADKAPTLKLNAHRSEGFGLDWSRARKGALATGGNCGLVAVWDVQEAIGKQAETVPVSQSTFHTKAVNSVSWAVEAEQVLLSASDDGKVAVWDIRAMDGNQPSAQVAAHDAVHAVACQPGNEHCFITSGTGGVIKLWDSRKLEDCVHTFVGHAAEVYALSWMPCASTVFASAGQDRRVHVWDLSRIGAELSPEDLEDGPPELMFVHGGHTHAVSDVAWHPTEPWMAASVDAGNVLQVWQIAEAIYAEDDEDEEADVAPPAAEDLE